MQTKLEAKLEKLMNERKERARSREWITTFALEEILGPQDDLGYFVQKLETENKSQPRGDFRILMKDGSVIWLEVKTVNDSRFEYLDDFYIPAPMDWRTPSGWSETDRFLIVVSGGQTGTTRHIWLEEPWEMPLKRFRAWGVEAGWDRQCFVVDISESPIQTVDFTEHLKETFAADSKTRMWGGY